MIRQWWRELMVKRAQYRLTAAEYRLGRAETRLQIAEAVRDRRLAEATRRYVFLLETGVIG